MVQDRGSPQPYEISAYDWDIDGDGNFDDAHGPIVTHIFSHAFHGFIGLKVTNRFGVSDIDYAEANIRETNKPPIITTSTPALSLINVTVGSTLPFQIQSTDPDGDDIVTTWSVDGGAAEFSAFIFFCTYNR